MLCLRLEFCHVVYLQQLSQAHINSISAGPIVACLAVANGKDRREDFPTDIQPRIVCYVCIRPLDPTSARSGGGGQLQICFIFSVAGTGTEPQFTAYTYCNPPAHHHAKAASWRSSPPSGGTLAAARRRGFARPTRSCRQGQPHPGAAARQSPAHHATRAHGVGWCPRDDTRWGPRPDCQGTNTLMRLAGRRRRGRCGSDAWRRKRRCQFKQTACPRSNLATCSDDCSCGGGADRPISLPVTQLKNGRPVPKPTENLAHRLVNLIHRFPIPMARPPAGPQNTMPARGWAVIMTRLYVYPLRIDFLYVKRRRRRLRRCGSDRVWRRRERGVIGCRRR